MLFTRFSLVASIVTLVAGVSFTDVQNDLKVADFWVKNATGSAQNFPKGNYPGPGLNLLWIQAAIKNITTAVNQAGADIQKSSAPSTSAAQGVLNSTQNPLQPDLKTLCTTLKSKRDTVRMYVGDQLVSVPCTSLRSAFNATLTAFIAKAPSAAIKSGGTAAKTDIDNLIKDVLAYYAQ